MALNLGAFEEDFLEDVEGITGLNFAIDHDPDQALPALPGVTLSLIGVMPRAVDIGSPSSDWECEWVVRLYLPFFNREQAHDDLVTYLPEIGSVVRALDAVGPLPEGAELNVGEEPEYDTREGSRKVVKRMTLAATIYAP